MKEQGVLSLTIAICTSILESNFTDRPYTIGVPRDLNHSEHNVCRLGYSIIVRQFSGKGEAQVNKPLNYQDQVL